MKALCPKCKKSISLKTDGSFRAHGYGRQAYLGYWCDGSWTTPIGEDLMAANHMDEGRGHPKDGVRHNKRDPWKEDLCNLIFTGIIKELNKNDIEYGYAEQTISIRNFTFMEDDVMRSFTVKICESH